MFVLCIWEVSLPVIISLWIIEFWACCHTSKCCVPNKVRHHFVLGGPHKKDSYISSLHPASGNVFTPGWRDKSHRVMSHTTPLVILFWCTPGNCTVFSPHCVFPFARSPSSHAIQLLEHDEMVSFLGRITWMKRRERIPQYLQVHNTSSHYRRFEDSFLFWNHSQSSASFFSWSRPLWSKSGSS